MKNLFFLIIIITPLYCFSQNITEKELKEIIKNKIKIERKNIFDQNELIFIADNTDSIFFKESTVRIYTDRNIKLKNKFCRTVELIFYHKKFMTFLDCQVCSEPTSCYVTTENKVFNYEIINLNNEILLLFKNKFETRLYKISNLVRNENGRISEFSLELM